VVNFIGKNIFFIADSDKFFYLYADALINKVKVASDSIIVIVYPVNGENKISKLKKLPGVIYLKYDVNHLVDILGAESLTFMSLHKWNSGIARNLIDLSDSVLDKLYVYLTDDEVARWYCTYKKFGSLISNNKKHISDDDIFVLAKINYFITAKEVFEEKLCEVLGRSDFSIVDAYHIFDILPTLQSNEAEALIMSAKSFSHKIKK